MKLDVNHLESTAETFLISAVVLEREVIQYRNTEESSMFTSDLKPTSADYTSQHALLALHSYLLFICYIVWMQILYEMKPRGPATFGTVGHMTKCCILLFEMVIIY